MKTFKLGNNSAKSCSCCISLDRPYRH